MQTLKQKGFTLIELLVVIVIIGILATISVATFSGYFAKARDAERQAAIRNASTVLKTARAVETISTFANTGTTPTPIDVSDILSQEGGFAMPPATQSYNYAYGYNSTALASPVAIVGDEFFFIVCKEETAGAHFIDGTARAVATVNALTALTMCDPANATPDKDPSDATVTNFTLTTGTAL